MFGDNALYIAMSPLSINYESDIMSAINLEPIWRVDQALSRMEYCIIIISILGMLLFTSTSVVIRYFNLPFPDTGELALVSMSPLTFVGAALCTYSNSHIRVEIVDLLDSHLMRRIVCLFVNLAELVFGCLFSYISYDFLAYAIVSKEVLADFGTPVYIPAGFMFLGALLIALHATIDILRNITTTNKG